MSRVLCNCWQNTHEEGAPGCLTQTSTESQPKEGVKVDVSTRISFEECRRHPMCDCERCSTRTELVEEFIRMQSDPSVGSGHISAVAAELMDTLIKKNADYAGGQEFFNFEGAAEFAGIEPFELILAQIGIKYTRIANLHGGDVPKNESLRDSFVDLAGYAVIAAAWLDAVNGDQDHG